MTVGCQDTSDCVLQRTPSTPNVMVLEDHWSAFVLRHLQRSWGWCLKHVHLLSFITLSHGRITFICHRQNSWFSLWPFLNSEDILAASLCFFGCVCSCVSFSQLFDFFGEFCVFVASLYSCFDSLSSNRGSCPGDPWPLQHQKKRKRFIMVVADYFSFD